MNPLQIKPNVPLTVALENPDGMFDFDLGMGIYQTTSGQTFTLPRPAVILLNTLDPDPGEEIVITKHWSGKRGEKAKWTVSLSPNSEKCRAKAETETSELTEQLQASIEQVQGKKRATEPPVPIRRPSRRQVDTQIQPRLFDRGTGTHGPAPAAVPISAPALLPAAARQRVGQIPANIATREILAFIQSDPNTANWSDQSRQDLLSTILIAAYRAGHVGLWERQP
jgi:hypothetical protein